MSTSPYPLPPGCIFREDFRSPALAAQNGLVITGGAWNPNSSAWYNSNLIYPLSSPINQVLAYSYAMSADEIAQDYRTIRGLSA